MVALSKISNLPHLSAMPSATVENTNVGYIITLTETLILSSRRLRMLFTEAKAPQVYTRTAHTTMRTFMFHMIRELRLHVDATPDSYKAFERYSRTTVQMAPQIGAPLSWAASSPTAPISNMKDVTSSGAIALVLDDLHTLFSHPYMHRTSIEAVWHFVEQYALHLKIMPLLCRYMPTTRLYLSEPRPSHESNPFDYDFEADAKAACRRIVDLGAFRRHRVKLCNNLNVSEIRRYSQLCLSPE